MKIVHVCETATGGVGIYIGMLCTFEDQDTNIVVAPERHAKGIDPKLDIRPYKATRRSVGALWHMLRSTLQIIRTERPDIVFFHSSFTLLALLGIRLVGLRTPAIYCSHGWSAWMYAEGSLKSRIVKMIEGSLCGLSNCIVNVSSADKDLAEENRYLGHHVVIENAVPEPASNVNNARFAQEPDRLHVLFVGRFDRQKGLDVLLPAFERAQKERPDLRLHIVGASIRQDSEELTLPDGAYLYGWVDKARIDDWYASADALIVPSRWEGLALVIPEALRNGTPILCSNRGAMPALIRHGATGEVFELTEEAIFDCLIKLDKAELSTRRPACRHLYENRYSFPRFAVEIKNLYHDVVTQKPEPKRVR